MSGGGSHFATRSESGVEKTVTDSNTPYPVESAEYALWCAYLHQYTAYLKVMPALLELAVSGSTDLEVEKRDLETVRDQSVELNEKALAAFQAYQRRRGTHPTGDPPNFLGPIPSDMEDELEDYEEELDNIDWTLHVVPEDEDSVADRLIEDAGGEPPDEEETD